MKLESFGGSERGKKLYKLLIELQLSNYKEEKKHLNINSMNNSSRVSS
jgi:hypothetical protein